MPPKRPPPWTPSAEQMALWPAMELPVASLAERRVERKADEWTRLVKDAVRAAGADAVGITRIQPHWVYEGYEITQQSVIMLCVACLAACPWNLPGVAESMVVKLATRRARVSERRD